MKKTILLDLDDTLVETKYRQYKVNNSFLNTTSFEEYIEFRKIHSCSNTRFMEAYLNSTDKVKRYNDYFLNKIESDEFLSHDRLIVDAELLWSISGKYDLILVSLRSNIENSIKQLKKLGIYNYFKEVYFLKHNKYLNPKMDVLMKLNKKENVFLFVGDSISDFDAAKMNNIDFIGVRTGLYELEGEFPMYDTVNDYLENLINDEI